MMTDASPDDALFDKASGLLEKPGLDISDGSSSGAASKEKKQA